MEAIIFLFQLVKSMEAIIIKMVEFIIISLVNFNIIHYYYSIRLFHEVFSKQPIIINVVKYINN